MTSQATAGKVIDGGFARMRRSARRCLALGVILLALSVLWWPGSARAESVADGARARVESLLDEGVKLLAEQTVTSQDFVDGFHRLAPDLEKTAGDRAETLLKEHRRVREAAKATGVRYKVSPQLPPDILGIYVYLPVI